MAQLIDVSTRKHPNTFAVVDDEDYERVMSAGKWTADVSGRTMYAHKTLYLGGGKRAARRQKVTLHAFILRRPAGTEVDHANMNGLDNRKENLRVCTKTENQRNKRKPRSGVTSPYKGVHRLGRGWIAQLNTKERPKAYIGYFSDPVEAAKAYDTEALKYYGEFAATNASLGLFGGA